MIYLIRHGESMANANQLPDDIVVGESSVPLTDRGKAQAAALGARLGTELLSSSLIYVSPYLRARQTLHEMLSAAKISDEARTHMRIHEDPRIREVEHAYGEMNWQRELQKRVGWFYYRYQGGESPADCFTRVHSFLTTMREDFTQSWTTHSNIVIVCHGITINVLLMALLRLSVTTFQSLGIPKNCGVVEVSDNPLDNPDLVGGGRYARGVTWYKKKGT